MWLRLRLRLCGRGAAGDSSQLFPGLGSGRLQLRELGNVVGDLGIAAGMRPGAREETVGAGEVVAIGKNAARFTVGDRVAGVYFPRWRSGPVEPDQGRDQFGCTRDGMLAEYVAAEEQAFVKIPDHLSFEEAATLPCAAVTAWSSCSREASGQRANGSPVEGSSTSNEASLPTARPSIRWV